MNMRIFILKVCEFIYIRMFHNSIQWIITLLNFLDFSVNVLKGVIQVLFCGPPFYWSLAYRNAVPDNRRLMVLANGPSLSEDLERLAKEETLNTDYAMMNFSINSELFLSYKPRFFCLADNEFFCPTYLADEVREVYNKLNEYVDWDLTLVVTYDVKTVKDFSKITNPKIKFQRVFNMRFNTSKNFKYWFFKRGLGIPGLGTVTNLAAFVGIQYGYKQIEFCGNDMSLLEGICVNDENRLCAKIKHFYDENVELQPIMVSDTQYDNLANYVNMIGAMIHSHNEIAKYGKYMGVNFINRTRKSMLDCYPRLIKIHPDEFVD